MAHPRPRPHAPLALALTLALSLVVGGCAGEVGLPHDGAAGAAPTAGGSGSPGTAAPTTTVFAPTTTAPPPPLRAAAEPTCPTSVDAGSFPAVDLGRTPSTTAPPPTTSTAPTATPPPPADGSSTGPPAPPAPPPRPDVPSALDGFRRDPRVAGTTLGVSVWIEGRGEATAENPDALMIPASDEKLVTGIGLFNLLDPAERLHTDLVATGPIDDGVLHGDLVLVGGGDPVLQRVGPDSLDELARRAVEAGLTRVDGRVLVDESRYDTVRTGRNWPGDWLESIGPMSALGVDHNMVTKDPAYVADPAVGNGVLMRFALGAHGIEVTGGVDHGHADQGVRLVGVESPPVRELLATMLTDSDNFIAELLTKEIGLRRAGPPGTTAAGLEAIHEVVTNLCIPIRGVAYDGSGLSRDDRWSVSNLRRLLQIAELQPWGDDFVSSLSIAGEKDSLAGRLAGPATAGRVRAKGGFLFASKSLSGYVTRADGRRAVFSIIVNGDLSSRRNQADDAIDDLVTALATLPP